MPTTNRISNEPWYVSQAPHLQAAAWAATALITAPWMGFEGTIFMAGLLLPPFAIFLALSSFARAAVRIQPSPSAKGRLLGCHASALVGIGMALWMAWAVAHSHASTAALAFLLIPFLWAVGGAPIFLLSWLAGRLVEVKRGFAHRPDREIL